jgi:protein-S-isoprenylcysteine O-methyltransferase Ste14
MSFPTNNRSQYHTSTLIQRGSTKPSAIGRAVLVCLRTLDPFLQYAILHRLGASAVRQLGGSVLSEGQVSHTGFAVIDTLDLSHYRLTLLCMSIGSALKQIYWVLFLGLEPIKVSSAIEIGIFITVCNSICSILATAAATSAEPDTPLNKASFWIGIALFVGGLLLEWISEIERYKFKRDPQNQGKVYTKGLWSLARHINYGGYTLWRTGYASASSGLVFGCLTAGFFLLNFLNQSIPELDLYCEQRVRLVLCMRNFRVKLIQSSMVSSGRHSRRKYRTNYFHGCVNLKKNSCGAVGKLKKKPPPFL